MFKAWHGSPYSFDKFSMSNAFGGIGHQTYGSGHSVTLQKSTAETFSNLKGKGSGTLYSVEIHSDDSRMLDFRKRVGEQSPHVRDALSRIAGSSIRNNMGADYAYEEMRYALGLNDRQLAEKLSSVGIDGIKYDVAGSPGTHYTIFDGDKIEITSKNGVPVKTAAVEPATTVVPKAPSPISEKKPVVKPKAKPKPVEVSPVPVVEVPTVAPIDAAIAKIVRTPTSRGFDLMVPSDNPSSPFVKVQVTVNSSFSPADRTAYVSNVWVRDDMRRQGVATKIYDKLEEILKADGKILVPSNSLKRAGFNFWRNRDPEAVANDLRSHEDAIGKWAAKKYGTGIRLEYRDGGQTVDVYKNGRSIDSIGRGELVDAGVFKMAPEGEELANLRAAKSVASVIPAKMPVPEVPPVPAVKPKLPPKTSVAVPPKAVLAPKESTPIVAKKSPLTPKISATPKTSTPKAVPPKAVPPKAVPPKAVPPKAVPPKAVPPKAVPPKAVPPKAVLAPKESTPIVAKKSSLTPKTSATPKIPTPKEASTTKVIEKPAEPLPLKTTPVAQDTVTSVTLKLDVVAPNAGVIRTTLLNTPMNGAPLKDWIEELEAADIARVNRTITNGILAGKSTPEIVAEIVGSPSLRYTDGVREVSRRGVDALVRTATNHAANIGRQLVWSENDDIVDQVRWVSTLDTRTSPICRERDGKVYPVDKGPRPPAHINCRSTTVAVLKSWRELGFDMDELAPGTRASMDGQVPADMTYFEWLSKRSDAVQRDVLGEARYDLWKNGGVSPDRFYDNGKYLTLTELRKKMPQAFEDAGI